MATFLDIGLVQNFSIVFSFLFVYVVIFSILEYSKLFGESKGIHAIMALAVAVIAILSGRVVQLISTMAPAFVVGIFFIFFLFLIYRMFGVEESWIKNAIVGPEGDAYYWVIIIGVLIVMASVAMVYGDTLLAFTSANTTAQGAIGTNIGATIFHPKVLGFIFFMLMAIFAVWLLSAEKIK